MSGRMAMTTRPPVDRSSNKVLSGVSGGAGLTGIASGFGVNFGVVAVTGGLAAWASAGPATSSARCGEHQGASVHHIPLLVTRG